MKRGGRQGQAPTEDTNRTVTWLPWPLSCSSTVENPLGVEGVPSGPSWVIGTVATDDILHITTGCNAAAARTKLRPWRRSTTD